MADHEPDVRSSGTVHSAKSCQDLRIRIFATDPEDEYVYVIIPKVRFAVGSNTVVVRRDRFPHKRDVNTLRTGDADLRFYVTNVQDG